MNSELDEFLRELGLSQYGPALRSHGFDDMETILMINEEHMKDLGMRMGHIMKLKKRLAAWAPAAPELLEEEPEEEVKTYKMAPAPVLVSEKVGLSLPVIRSVKQSWTIVESLGTEVVAELFYKNLFKIAPVTKELFPITVRNRHRDWSSKEEEDENDPVNSPALRKLFSKVLDAVGTAVAGLQDMASLVPHLTALGMRHVNYNTDAQHFAYGGQALLLTLRAGLGELYTPDVETAWKLVYDFVSATIVTGLKMAREKQEEINIILQRRGELGGVRSHRTDSSLASVSMDDACSECSTSCRSASKPLLPLAIRQKEPQPPSGLRLTPQDDAKEALAAAHVVAKAQPETVSCLDAPILPMLLQSMSIFQGRK